MGAKQFAFYTGSINGIEAGAQTYSQEGTQTLPAAQHYKFSPALGIWDPFQQHPKRSQGASPTFATKKRQELKAFAALSTLSDKTSTEVASATDASWGNSSHDKL